MIGEERASVAISCRSSHKMTGLIVLLIKTYFCLRSRCLRRRGCLNSILQCWNFESNEGRYYRNFTVFCFILAKRVTYVISPGLVTADYVPFDNTYRLYISINTISNTRRPISIYLKTKPRASGLGDKNKAKSCLFISANFPHASLTM